MQRFLCFSSQKSKQKLCFWLLKMFFCFFIYYTLKENKSYNHVFNVELFCVVNCRILLDSFPHMHFVTTLQQTGLEHSVPTCSWKRIKKNLVFIIDCSYRKYKSQIYYINFCIVTHIKIL